MRRVAAAGAYAPFVAWWGTWLLAATAGMGRLSRPRPMPTDPSVTVDVLIPAHDEERTISRLVQSLLGPKRPACLRRVLVVADHCSDGTAAAARAAGAEVLERRRGPRGKPAALRDGLALLTADEPADGVLFLDADVVLGDAFVNRLAAELATGADAVQSANLSAPPDPGGTSGGVELGIYLRNLLRPAGLTRMGCPSHLTGTGMLLSRRALAAANFGDHLAEDLAMTQDLVGVGIYPRLVPEAVQHSALPDGDGLDIQRQRWEGGQLATLRRVPALAWRLARRGRLRGLVGVADWSSPPLTVGVAAFSAIATTHTAVVAARRAPVSSLTWPLAAAGALGAYLALGASAHGGPRTAAALATRVPAYVAWKFGVYARLARRPGAEWQRTPRTPSPQPPPDRVAVETINQGG